MSEKKVELNRDADGLVREETQSGIYVKPIYTPEDLKSEKYERDIGDPGVYPFTRGIYPEMEDGGHVVFICTPQDLAENFDRLEEVLDQLRPMMGPCPPLPPPPVLSRRLSVRQALFAKSELLPLENCEGKISACQIAPYPPGVPVVAPGEVISKKELAYFVQIGYNVKSEVRVITSL